MKKKDVTAGAPASLIDLARKEIKKIEEKFIASMSPEQREDLEKMNRGEHLSGMPLDLETLENITVSNLKQNLPYARKLWQWVKWISASNLGKNLVLISNAPSIYNFVVFCDERVGLNEQISLAFSVHGLMCIYNRDRNNGLLVYDVLHSSKDIAKTVTMSVLEKVCAAIDDGTIWQQIEHGFEYLKEKNK